MIESVSIDCTPGRSVYHVWENGHGEHRHPYRIMGLAWDTRGGGWRVVMEDTSDGRDRGRLFIFTADTFARSFVPQNAPAPPAPAEAPPEKVAGRYAQGSGV